jgi:sialic acid synthase SpsE
MTEAEKKVRAYLGEIGRRGGITSRRELTKSHARQMVAIREAKRGSVESGKNLAAARSQTNKTFVSGSDLS